MLIAQVSDIHASPENNHLHLFKRALGWLAQVNPDVLVLSGDLTDNRWLEGYQHIATCLRQQNYPSLILPGNSDCRRLMQSVWDHNTWAKGTHDGALHFACDRGDLQLVGLDSTVETQEYGSVTEHLGWLGEQLYAADGKPSLLFMHHHVFASGIPTLDKTQCRGLDGLAALIHRSPNRLLAIASGHVHRPVAGMFAGIPAYICGSVCPANPLWFGTANVPSVQDPPGLMLYRYDDRVLTGHHVSIRC